MAEAAATPLLWTYLLGKNCNAVFYVGLANKFTISVCSVTKRRQKETAASGEKGGSFPEDGGEKSKGNKLENMLDKLRKRKVGNHLLWVIIQYNYSFRVIWKI